MTLRLVIFDMDDVLCHYDLGKRLRALSRLSGRTPRDIRSAIWDSGFEDDADAGRYKTAEDYLAAFASRLGYPIARAEWIDARRQAMQPDHDVLAFASKTGTHLDIAIYTNNGPLLKAAMDEVFPDAYAIFGSRIFCSYEFGTKKPDPQSYTRLLTRMGASPEETWFIDDKQSNVDGARLAGLNASLFVGLDRLSEDAKDHGLAISGR